MRDYFSNSLVMLGEKIIFFCPGPLLQLSMSLNYLFLTHVCITITSNNEGIKFTQTMINLLFLILSLKNPCVRQLVLNVVRLN